MTEKIEAVDTSKPEGIRKLIACLNHDLVFAEGAEEGTMLWRYGVRVQAAIDEWTEKLREMEKRK